MGQSYTDGRDTLTLTDDNDSGHILELLGWEKVESEGVVPSHGDGADGQSAGDANDGGSKDPELVEGGGPEKLAELSNDQLRAALERRNLPTKGNKDELVERLQKALDTELIGQ